MAPRNASPKSTASASSSTSKPASSASSIASPVTSTPPTSIADESSVHSDNAKMDAPIDTVADTPATPTVPVAPVGPQSAQATPDTPASEGRRSVRSSRSTVVTYNVQMLAGTAIHTPTKYLEKHHKNVLHGAYEEAIPKHSVDTPPKKKRFRVQGEDLTDPVAAQLASETAQAAQRRRSSRVDLRKEALKNVTAAGEAVVRKGPEVLSNVASRVGRVLRDALATESESSSRSSKGSRSQPSTDSSAEPHDDEDDDENEDKYVKRREKQWETQGLYVGQHRELNPKLKESQNRLRRPRKVKEPKILPLPMFAGERMLSDDFQRDFKLPFDVYHPLPRRVKVEGWTRLSKNRFIGDASALWKHDKHDNSTCQCSPQDGCGENCHNRIMSYECNETNCRLSPDQCSNRPFAQLKIRAKGNGYDYGVEVMETADKGFGVRAMRSFEPNQIIVEYAGEIITQAECERRMKYIYKKDKVCFVDLVIRRGLTCTKCYYLMSFDNKMIIDATRGTIARFVNHSCEPNCGMFKWTVNGEPRMALFAGPRGIMTGEELTYDYNFDPFSHRSQQICRCGTRSCRGVLGPKPKYNPLERSFASTFLAGTKRKIAAVFGTNSVGNDSRMSSPSSQPSPKKRKLAPMAVAAVTKRENADARSAAEKEKMEREAKEQAEQRARREERIARRQSELVSSANAGEEGKEEEKRNSMPAAIGGLTRPSLPMKRTPRAVPRPGALKQKRRDFRGLTGLLGRKRGDGETAERSVEEEEVVEEEIVHEVMDVNITPASLRSAKKKMEVMGRSSQPSSASSAGSAKRSSGSVKSKGVKRRRTDVVNPIDSDGDVGMMEVDDDYNEAQPTKMANAGNMKAIRKSESGLTTRGAARFGALANESTSVWASVGKHVTAKRTEMTPVVKPTNRGKGLRDSRGMFIKKDAVAGPVVKGKMGKGKASGKLKA
ncbi:hypothetical protein M011DRAFT_48495 [Sporormia fimetaria CBS 119925]|uniref:SET domain-containing protein n=1 Tax=Sporormia fimetaria CBS 119925 TaxID=1340428 RepID=A0A6A6VCI1_9PLEO|nr:hypothetical protein M011DRAFT_48495 [Sporormia fimetaria CBS 119925]